MAQTPKKFHSYLRFSAMGLEMGISVVVAMFIGQYLDMQFGTDPWLLLLFLVFGMTAGLRSVIRALKKVQEEIESNDPKA